MSGSVLILVEFLLAFLLHTVALVRILLILLSTARKGIGSFFMALLTNWTFVAILFLPYETHAIVNWRPDKTLLHNGRVLFYIAMPAHLFLAAIPVSVFFLTVERICIIQMGPNYGRRVKMVLNCAYFVVLAIGLVVNLGGYILAMPTLPEKTHCEIFGCILREYMQFYLGWRAFCAFFNFIAGIIFFVLFFRTNRQLLAHNSTNKRINRANNILTSIAILSELFLAFLPHFGPFIWEKFNGTGSSLATGPLSELMSSVEVLLFSSIYSRVLSARDQQNSSANAVAPAEMHIDIKGRRMSDRLGGPIERRQSTKFT